MVLAARGIDRTAGSAGVFGECLPRLAGVLQDVHHRRVVEIRVVSIAAYAKGAPPEDRDIVRLGGICNTRPTFGERVQVCEPRHVRGGPVDLVEILVLHQDDDELIEVARGLVSHGSSRRQSGRPQGVPGERAGADERDHDEENRRRHGADAVEAYIHERFLQEGADVTRTRTAGARRLGIRVRSGADAGDQSTESGSPAHPREFSHTIYRFGHAGRIRVESFRNQPPYLKKWSSSNKTSAPNRPRLSITYPSPCNPTPVREDHDGVRSETVSRNPYRLAISPTIRGRHRRLGIPLDQAQSLHRADVRGGVGP